MSTQMISEHFSLNELTKTETGLDNDPDVESGAALVRLCNLVLESIRALLGVPLITHSAYRCEAVNRAVGGARNSAHMEGRACDFHPSNGMDIMVAFGRIKESSIEFDKLIIEHKSGSWWIHVQIARVGSKARREVYRAEMQSGTMKYTLIK